MENRPPQPETPRKPPPPNSGRKTNGSGGSPTPPWLWLLLLGGFALIFWQFVPKTEVVVPYYPWFYGEVKADNIKSITIQGDEIRGELRQEKIYENTATQTKQKVTKFITTTPPEPSLAIVQKLIKLDEDKKANAANSTTQSSQWSSGTESATTWPPAWTSSTSYRNRF